MVEIEITKETKILEKIQRAIESYPLSRKSIKKEITFSPKEEKIENLEVEKKNTDEIDEELEEKINNDKEECMENSLSMDIKLPDKNDNDKLKALLEKNDDIKSDINLDNFISGNIEGNLDEKNSQKSVAFSKANSQKDLNLIDIEKNEKEFSVKSPTHSQKYSEISDNICYIAPYSGWSFRKLDKEKVIVTQKILLYNYRYFCRM